MHPYTLVVTQEETVWELPLGWEDNGFPPLNPIYWDEERTGRGWTRDRAGRPVLVLWFDSFSVEKRGVVPGENVQKFIHLGHVIAAERRLLKGALGYFLWCEHRKRAAGGEGLLRQRIRAGQVV